MVPASNNGTTPHLHRSTTLPTHIAGLCAEESASLTRPTGDGSVIPRRLDPNEKPRTTGARTAG